MRHKCTACRGRYVIEDDVIEIDILWTCIACGHLKGHTQIDPVFAYYQGKYVICKYEDNIWAAKYYDSYVNFDILG